MKDESANRASLLTPAGAAAIAVVRLAGPGVPAFLKLHFSRPVTPDRCIHGNLLDGERVIDDPVVVLHGDRADINLHGGTWVVHECLELARRAGFTIVKSDPTLLDASSMLEREMLESLPLARTPEAIRALLIQPQLWASSFSLHPASLSPSKASAFDPPRIAQILADRSLWWMLHPPKIAIVGIPNVGKSTLANQLFGRDRSITADVPGTTRDWVGDWANLDGLPIHLLDTPGQRMTTDPIEQAAISRSGTEIESADLVLLVLDPTQPLDGSQSDLIRRFPDALLILNKSDRPATWDTASFQALRTIATTGQGINALQSSLRKRFVSENLDASPMWWTLRQRDLLVRAHQHPEILREIIDQ